MANLETETQWLKANVSARAIGVDREARVIRGMVLAQEGPFKTPGRGEFDVDGLKGIVKLANQSKAGLKSRFSHPTQSDDGLGKHLGRVRDTRLDKVYVERDGKTVQLAAVRGDLYFDPSASKTPSGDLAGYVMDLAESDSDAISSSLVIEPEMLFRLDSKNRPLTDKDGRELPPLWIPKRLHAADVVDTGDAVDGMLSAADLAQALSVGLTPELERLFRFDNVARLATQLLDGMFRGQSRESVEARCQGWLGRYLLLRFGEPEPPEPAPLMDARRKRLEEQAAYMAKLKGA